MWIKSKYCNFVALKKSLILQRIAPSTKSINHPNMTQKIQSLKQYKHQEASQTWPKIIEEILEIPAANFTVINFEHWITYWNNIHMISIFDLNKSTSSSHFHAISIYYRFSFRKFIHMESGFLILSRKFCIFYLAKNIVYWTRVTFKKQTRVCMCVVRATAKKRENL